MKPLEPEKLIVIGASTGGPGHISQIVEALNPVINATLIIAQHMGHEYIPSFVKRLNETCQILVCQAEHQQVIKPSTVYITTKQTSIKQQDKSLIFNQYEQVDGAYNPDVNILFSSIAKLSMGKNIMAIILTGIGDDGAKGCLELSHHHAVCLAEHTSTAIVDGMPLQARQLVKDIIVLPFDKIIERINTFST